MIPLCHDTLTLTQVSIQDSITSVNIANIRSQLASINTSATGFDFSISYVGLEKGTFTHVRMWLGCVHCRAWLRMSSETLPLHGPLTLMVGSCWLAIGLI